MKKLVKVLLLAIAVMVGVSVFTLDTADAAIVKPAKVTSVKVTSTNYNTVKVTWAKAKNAKKYQVYRATSKNGKYKLVKTTTSRSYSNTKLTTGTKYYYKVRAVNGKKYSSYSAKVAGTPTLNKTTVTATSGTGSNTVKWTKVTGASGYKVYRSTSSSGSYSCIKTTTSLSYTDSSATAGTTYYYKVRAYRTVSGKAKYSAYSAVKNATSKLTVPTVTATSGTGSNTISWTKVANASGYQVYRATSSGGTYSCIKTTTGTSYTDSSATAGTTYYYKVRAYRTVSSSKTVYSSYSSVKTATSKSATVSLSTPSITVSSSSGYNTVGWSAISNASGYEIYRSTSSSGSYTKLSPPSSTSYKDTNVTAGTTYYYKVRAYNTTNGTTVYSSFSSVKSVVASGTGIEVNTNCYLSYNGTKIYIGETFTSSVNAALNGGTAVSYTAKRANIAGTDEGYGEYTYFYCYDTTDYDNFLMLIVNGGKIGGWITTRDEVGYYNGSLINTGVQEDTYDESWYWQTSIDEGVYLFSLAETYVDSTDPYEIGDIIIGGIMDNLAYQSSESSIEEEEIITEYFINAVRVARGSYALEHSDIIYGDGETYGTKAYARTMAESMAVTHSAALLTTGPLAGTSFSDREATISEASGNTICTVNENAAAGANGGEYHFWVWYTSVGHRVAMMNESNVPQNCNNLSLMAVAGYRASDGTVYWGYEAGCTHK